MNAAEHFARFKTAIRLHPSPLVTAGCLFYLGHILFQGKIATSELGAFWAIFCLCWALVKRHARLEWHILYFPLFLYGAASLVSAALADRRIHHAFESMLWFKMLIFPAALTLFTLAPRFREWALRGQIAFAVYVSSYGIYQYVALGRRDLDRRITGPSTHVLTYSNVLLALSLLILVVWFYRRKWWQLGALAIVCFALMLTFTRSVWLGWAAAASVLLLLKRPKWIAFAAPAAVLFLILMPLDFFARLTSTFDTKQESNLDRIRMLEAGVEIIKDYPLLGVGPANVKEVYVLYRKHDAPRFRIAHLHNNVVQIWAERGVVALAAYLLLLALFLRECARGWGGPQRMWAEIGVALTVGLTVAGLFEFNFGDTEVFYVTLDLFALVVASLNEPARDAVVGPNAWTAVDRNV